MRFDGEDEGAAARAVEHAMLGDFFAPKQIVLEGTAVVPGAALARVASELVPLPGALALAGALYAASFVPWAIKYAPLYWRPRADGRPG